MLLAAVRAADPATCLRPGGRTIGDIIAAVDVPMWVRPQDRAEYRLDVFFFDEMEAAYNARLKKHGAVA